jgi:hypothetical protein
MTQSNQINRTKVFMFGLLISATAMFASCTPKYGCYYGMLENPSQTIETCDDTDVVNSQERSIAIMTNN